MHPQLAMSSAGSRETPLQLASKDLNSTGSRFVNVSPKIKESLENEVGRSLLSPTAGGGLDDGWHKLYNPKKNTINLAKLSLAL